MRTNILSKKGPFISKLDMFFRVLDVEIAMVSMHTPNQIKYPTTPPSISNHKGTMKKP